MKKLILLVVVVVALWVGFRYISSRSDTSNEATNANVDATAILDGEFPVSDDGSDFPVTSDISADDSFSIDASEPTSTDDNGNLTTSPEPGMF